MTHSIKYKYTYLKKEGTRIHTYMDSCMHAYIHIYIHIDKHIYTHTYTQTYSIVLANIWKQGVQIEVL